MATSVPPDAQPSSGSRGVPRSVLWIAVGVAVSPGVVVGGALVAVVRRPDHDTAVGCVASNVARRGLPSVVTIGVQGAGASGSGSGSVIRSDGYILTNNDGVSEPARLVGRGVATDLAVVKVKPSGSPSRRITHGPSATSSSPTAR